jgi:hypothetical protein
VTAFVFPTKAINHEVKAEEPVHNSFNISKQMKYPREAYEELKSIRQSIDEGYVSYSYTPNVLTRSLHTIFSPKVSHMNIMRGFKTYDRGVIDGEMKKVSITNCAHSARRVIIAVPKYPQVIWDNRKHQTILHNLPH